MSDSPSLPPRTGQILVLCAPSGTGKSTLVKRLLEEFSNFAFSVSYTTRAPRGREQDGVDYHFVDREQFIALRDQGFFAEWAEVHSNFYGTPEEPVRKMLTQGRDVLFDIDFQGADQLRGSFPEGLFVFLLPPSRDALVKRLTARGTDSEGTVARRLANARKELDQAERFGFLIVNDDLEQAYDELRSVYVAGKTRPGCRPGLAGAVARHLGRT